MNPISDIDINLFDNEKKTIPKTLEECHKPSKLVVALRKYAHSIHQFGKILCIIVIILGLISAITSSLIYDVSAYGKVGDIEDFDFWNFLISFGITILEAWSIETVASFLSVLLSALANLVYNNSITANVSLYQAEKQSTDDKNQET